MARKASQSKELPTIVNPPMREVCTMKNLIDTDEKILAFKKHMLDYHYCELCNRQNIHMDCFGILEINGALTSLCKRCYEEQTE